MTRCARPPVSERSTPDARDAGFSLIEVVVAMVLLGIVALMTVPFFALSLSQTSATSSQTSATDAVGALLEQARATPTCTALSTLPQPQYSDGQGRAFKVVATLSPSASSCISKSVMTVTAKATRIADGTLLSSAATLVFVP